MILPKYSDEKPHRIQPSKPEPAFPHQSTPVVHCLLRSLQSLYTFPLLVLRRKHMIRARFTVLSTETVTGEYLDLGHSRIANAWLAERQKETAFKRPEVNHLTLPGLACCLLLVILSYPSALRYGRRWQSIGLRWFEYHASRAGRQRTTKLDPKEGAKRKRKRKPCWF